MTKILRVDALVQISQAIQENDYQRANKMLEIIDKSIARDKANNTYSSEIQLSREEKKFFNLKHKCEI